jgi:hypothetical protein
VDVTVRPKTAKVAQLANPPITVDVVLMCDRCRAFTPHKFLIVRKVGLGSFEQIYNCACCKTERRFGLLS